MCESKKAVYIVMELVTGGTLRQIIDERKQLNQPFSDEEISIMMQGIFSAVNCMHEAHVLHRDIKLGI